MNYTDYMSDEFWNDFGARKFFSTDEISLDMIEAFQNGCGGKSRGLKEFDTYFIEFDAKKSICVYNGKNTVGYVHISAKNRCIYIYEDESKPWIQPDKLDFSDKPFSLSTNPESKTVTVDGLTMTFEKAFAFNMTSMLIKYSEIKREEGEAKPIVRVIDNIEPFYIDNRIRLSNNIDLRQVYSSYIAQNRTLQLTLSEIKYQKFNEYGDIEIGGTAELYCAVPSAEQMLEDIEVNAKWHEEHSESTYAEALEWASDTEAISTSITSSFAIKDYEIDDWKSSPSFWVRQHLFEFKHIYGSTSNLRIYIFKDLTRTAGIQFELNDYRQYYLFGEYLLLMKSNYQNVLRTLKKKIAESKDATGKIKCPVCGAYNEDGANVCQKCLFDDLSPVFLNRDDALNWEQEVVAPYREKYASGKVIQFRRE